MKSFVCNACGATDLQIEKGHVVCPYCETKYNLTADDFDFYGFHKKDSAAIGISLGADIEMLLRKCRANPKNARKYANLILDIDPDNKEALKYL